MIDAEIFQKTPHHAFRIYRDRREREFVDSMERTPLRFEDVVDTYSGLIARYGQESVIGPREGEFVIKERGGRAVYIDPAPGARWRSALHSGSEVEPFHIQWRGGTVYIPDDYEMLRRVYKSGFDLERYASEKVFLRQTGDRLIAARDRSGLLCLNNVHVLTPRTDPQIDIRFLCGVLMSKPIHRYYQSIALEAGRPLAQVDLVTVRALPFPCDGSGAPIGLTPPSQKLPQSGFLRTLRHVDAAIRRGQAAAAIELFLATTRPQVEPAQATAIVCRLVELAEGNEDPRLTRVRTAAREALDGAVAVLFGIGSSTAATTA